MNNQNCATPSASTLIEMLQGLNSIAVNLRSLSSEARMRIVGNSAALTGESSGNPPKQIPSLVTDLQQAIRILADAEGDLYAIKNTVG